MKRGQHVVRAVVVTADGGEFPFVVNFDVVGGRRGH
jgi:hypothetical protein